MKITYTLDDKNYSFNACSGDEAEKLNFLLTNNKGDFLNLGIKNNSSKFQGLNVLRKDDFAVFKFIDEIVLEGVEPEEIVYSGYKVERIFKSKFEENVNVVNNSFNAKTKDRFYLGPTGGMVYEIENYEGDIFVDADFREIHDFDPWGKDVKIFRNDGDVIVEYSKYEGEVLKYKCFMGIKSTNLLCEEICEWIPKDYSYSLARNSLSRVFVNRLVKINIVKSKKLVFAVGFSLEEVMLQLKLLSSHDSELENYEKDIINGILSEGNQKNTSLVRLEQSFLKPVPQDMAVAYELSKNAIYNFLKKDISYLGVNDGFYAGYPWFVQFWSRDELVGLRAFINIGELELVREKIFTYLNMVNSQTGMLRRIVTNKDSEESFDGCFWLAKRLVDFIFYLDEKGKLDKVFSKKDISYAYSVMNNVFNKLIKDSWDFDSELVKVKYADSWMDTIPVEFPLDIQVQFLDFISSMTILSTIAEKEDETKKFLDLESLFREKIRDTYYRNGRLFNEAYQSRHNSNVFLAYYLYQDIFSQEEWEEIFDNALLEMRSIWGGISSLSKKDLEFQQNYTGENNLSYHRGDSWFWINNVAAIAMNHLNEKKYRRDIGRILTSSTNDILKYGCVGYASEVSSASEQKSEGCFAQFWSSSTYIEMIDSLFEKRK